MDMTENPGPWSRTLPRPRLEKSGSSSNWKIFSQKCLTVFQITFHVGFLRASVVSVQRTLGKTSIQLETIETHKDKTNNKTSNRQIEISLCCHRRGRRKERHGESTRWGHFRQGHTCHCCRIEEKQNGRFHFFSVDLWPFANIMSAWSPPNFKSLLGIRCLSFHISESGKVCCDYLHHGLHSRAKSPSWFGDCVI